MSGNFPGQIILTMAASDGIGLTGKRGTFTIFGNPKGAEYVQVGIRGPSPRVFHVGWVKVADLAAAMGT